MQPAFVVTAAAAIQEDVVLAAVAVEITIQENLPFLQKSRDGRGANTSLRSLRGPLPLLP